MRTPAFIAHLVLSLICATSAERPTADVPIAEGMRLPQALASADLRFSVAGDKLLVVRQYVGGAPLVTIHDVTRDPPRGFPGRGPTLSGRALGRRIYFPLSSPDLFADNVNSAARQDGVIAEFDPGGKQLVTTSYRTARLWDISTGEKERWPKPIALDLPGSALAAFTKDRKHLLTASLVGTKKFREQARFEVKLWDAGSGKVVGEPSTAIVPDRLASTMRGLALAPDGASFLTAAGSSMSDARTVQIWDAKTLKPFPNLVYAAGSAFHYGPDGKTLIAISRSEITLWDLTIPKPICGLPTPEVAKGAKDWSWPYGLQSPLWVAVHPNGTSVLCRQGDQAKLWDLNGEKPAEKLTLRHSGAVYRMVISPDGKKAATACQKPDEVLVWSLETGKPLLKIPVSGSVKAMEFSPDGELLATANAGDVELWNVAVK